MLSLIVLLIDKFQFQSGSIKRTGAYFFTEPSIYFNSKVVRLKANTLEDVSGQFALFQFQSGSIKSGFSQSSESKKMLFQFQSGSIKR